MLGNLDAATGDALRSFHDALDHAQQSLQRDEERLSATAQLLSNLTLEVDCLKADIAPNSPTRQRREALQAEKLKLLHHTRHQREAIAETAAHIQHMKEPRAKLTERVAALRADVKALRRQYGLRAAQVHTFIAQFLQPQNSLESLRCQLAQLQQARASEAEHVSACRRRLEERKADLAALKDTHRFNGITNPNGDVTAGNGKPPGSPGNAEAAAVYAPALGGNGEQLNDKNQDCAASVLLHSEPEKRSEMVRRRSKQLAAHKDAEIQQAAEQERLESLRVDLKRQVLLLCKEIEGADAAQQREQKAFHDALDNAASGAGEDVHRLCQRCNSDLFQGFL
ncbi:hypothetical protein, conserved [Leishmania tarentolae]|uniref:Uncharacterized protein n=1 Tax=Leishmania tarentolae TaxID=5689 RepID=A0A640KQ20_LEITA|nr:hypothetical protein, conserved [Leishmania tarentolae]